jgi:hypothetical protein
MLSASGEMSLYWVPDTDAPPLNVACFFINHAWSYLTSHHIQHFSTKTTPLFFRCQIDILVFQRPAEKHIVMLGDCQPTFITIFK